LTFEEKILADGWDIPKPPLVWIYIKLVLKSDGTFKAVTFVEAEGWNKAVDVIFDKHLIDNPAETVAFYIEVPKDKLPPPEYLNRRLTRSEVETVWPWIKQKERA